MSEATTDFTSETHTQVKYYDYSGGWKTDHLRNSNCRGLFGFLMVDKMAAALFCFPVVRIIGKQNKMVAILFLDHWKKNFKTFSICGIHLVTTKHVRWGTGIARLAYIDRQSLSI